MKRSFEKEVDDSDEDIWAYTSQKRQKQNPSEREKSSLKAAPKQPIIARSGEVKARRPSRRRSPKLTKVSTATSRPKCQTSKTNLIGSSHKGDQDALQECGCPMTTVPRRSSESRPTFGKDSKFVGSEGAICDDSSCPSCQMPFRSLAVAESPRWHVMDCMKRTLVTRQECPAGLGCDCTVPSHYWKFGHSILANYRAGIQPHGSDTVAQLQQTSTSNAKEEARQASRRLNFDETPTPSIQISQRIESMEQTINNDTSSYSPATKLSRTWPKTPASNVTVSQSNSPYFKKTQSQIPNSTSLSKTHHPSTVDLQASCGFNSQSFQSSQSWPLVSPVKDTFRGLATIRETEGVVLDGESEMADPLDGESETVDPLDGESETADPLDGESETADPLDGESETADPLDGESETADPLDGETADPLDGESETVDPLDGESETADPLDGESENADPLPSTSVALQLVDPTNSRELPLQREDQSELSDSAGDNFDLVDSDELFTEEFNELSRNPAQLSQASEDQDHLFTSIIEFTPRPEESNKDVERLTQKKVSSQHEVSFPPAPQSSCTVQKSILNFFKPSGQTKHPQLRKTTLEDNHECYSKMVNPSTGSLQSGSAIEKRPLQCARTRKVGKPPCTGMSDDSSHMDSTREGAAGGTWGTRGKRPCPFYKKIPGSPFTVDAFQFGSIPGCRAYFLTHFHYDHYAGLTKKFAHPIYCSKITANLVQKKLRVESSFLNTLTLNEPKVIEGVEVTFMEANHCPGSVILLFKLPNGQIFLHTGDFRANPAMEQYSPLVDTHIHQLYLDTTYCEPSYSFPPQQNVIDFAAKLASDTIYENPNTLVVVGSYTIGKERIFIAIAEALNSRVCVTREKLAILECLEDKGLEKRLTLKPLEAKVHVIPMNHLRIQNLEQYLEKLRPRFDRILAFEPTGWTHCGTNKKVSLEKMRPKIKRGNITLFGVPYSEHSSYSEMKRFCQFLRPDKILPTVNNGNPASRTKMERLFHQWMNEDLSSPGKQLKQCTISGFPKYQVPKIGKF